MRLFKNIDFHELLVLNGLFVLPIVICLPIVFIFAAPVEVVIAMFALIVFLEICVFGAERAQNMPL